MKRIFIFLIFSMVAFVFSAIEANATDTKSLQPQELVDKSVTVFQSFISDPNMEWFRAHVKEAKGIFIVPQMIRAGFLVGGSGGEGILVARDPKSGIWSYPAFYTMSSISVGLQVGAEVSEIILMIMTDHGMNSMLSTSFKLGGDATLAAGPVGGGAKVATADIFAYARSKGAFVGVSVEGAMIKTHDSHNTSYYGDRVSVVDVLIRRSKTNKQADNLREVISRSLELSSTK